MKERGRALAAGIGLSLCGVALVVLAGWLLDVAPLRSLSGGAVAMNPLTALGFGALGAALVLAARPGERDAALIVVLCAAAAVVTLTRMLAYAGAPDARLDQLLFRSALAAYDPPNRMAPNTALAMFACAAAMPLVRAPAPSAVLAGQLAALGAVVTGLVTLSGYAFGVDDLAGLRAYIPMALPTAFAFVGLGTGILALRPDAGLTRVAAAPTPGGQLFRRTAPAAVLLPALLVWLAARGVDAGLFSSHIAISIAVIVGTILLVALLGTNARRLDRAEAVRAAADQTARELLLDVERKSAELAAANAELEAFSYSVSHDLRAPLRSISGFSQILVEDYGPSLDDEARGHLGRIARAAQRMSQLIDDLLELSRVSRGPLERTNVDLTAIARDVTEELQMRDPARTVHVRIEPDLGAAADARLVRIALANLLENAWKYTARTERAEIEVARQAGAHDVFLVRDNGVGFDTRWAERLFTPFQRLHADAEFEGSGIGLATVRRIAHRHGGRVWADAAPGSGATFYFTLNPEATE